MVFSQNKIYAVLVKSGSGKEVAVTGYKFCPLSILHHSGNNYLAGIMKRF